MAVVQDFQLQIDIRFTIRYFRLNEIEFLFPIKADIFCLDASIAGELQRIRFLIIPPNSLAADDDLFIDTLTVLYSFQENLVLLNNFNVDLHQKAHVSKKRSMLLDYPSGQTHLR